MEVAKSSILDDYYKLRISPKKLSSGRYQVKFFATIGQKREVYGYLLAESGETLRSVISRIKKQLRKMQRAGEFDFFHLNSELNTNSNQLMIFHA